MPDARRDRPSATPSARTYWVFGYGSLIWRPDFPFVQRQPAHLPGYVRRFWQGSHDHRGVSEAPGRVVTLVEAAGAQCLGMAYELAAEVYAEVLDALDVREQNGYARFVAPVRLRAHGGAGAANGSALAQGPRADGALTPHGVAGTVEALVYIATPGNPAFLGPAPLPALAAQIHVSRGPSGHNRDYLFELAAALRALGVDHVDDAHVYELEAAVRALDPGDAMAREVPVRPAGEPG